MVQTITISGGSISNLVFHPNSSHLLVVDDYLTEQIQYWPIGGTTPIWQLNDARAAQFSPQGQFVWIGNRDWKTGRLVQTESGEVQLPISDAEYAEFSPDEQYLLATSPGYSTSRLIALVDGSPVYTLTNTDQVEFSPNGTYLLARQFDNTDVLTTTTGEVNLSFNDVEAEFVQPDDRYLAVYGDLEPPRILYTVSGKKRATLGAAPDNLMQPQLSPSGKYLAGLSSRDTVRVWEFEDGFGRFYTISASAGPVEGFHFHNNDTQLITLGYSIPRTDPAPTDKTTRIWDIVNGNELMVFGDNRERVLTPNQEQIIELKDEDLTFIHTTVLTSTYREIGGVTSLLDARLSPDGRYMRTIGRRVPGWRIWDTTTGKLVEQLKEIAYSSDGRAVAKISGQQAQLWLD